VDVPPIDVPERDVDGVEVKVSDDPHGETARRLVRCLTDAVRERGEAFVALSGGTTAPPMIAELVSNELPWDRIGVWQVDERVVPDGHRDRNAEQLAAIPGHKHLMPVTAADLHDGASWYEAGLPDRFDAVHLGIGDDGHTASWAPGAEAVAASDNLVEVTDTFNGYRRMTLTPRAVNAARLRLVLAAGAPKASILRRWLDGDSSLPAHRLRREGTILFVDHAADPTRS
jgi:6-phosphogluconolactonase/glucosamine-6-phosphate isomerase/deaminase